MATSDITNLFFAGVGGQGLVLANAVTSASAIECGLDVKTSDIYGLAMRGGAVYGFHRHGAKVLTSTFAAGQGDLLVALEPLEGLRWAHMMRRGGRALVNTRPLFPSPVLLEKEKYPTNVPELLVEAGLTVKAIDALGLAAEAGSERMANTVLLGALSIELPKLSLESWHHALTRFLPGNRVEQNWKAFLMGREVGA